MIPGVTKSAGRSVRIHKLRSLLVVAVVYLGYIGISWWWKTPGLSSLASVFSGPDSSVSFLSSEEYTHNRALTDPYLAQVIVGDCENLSETELDSKVWTKYCHETRDTYDPRKAAAVWIDIINRHLETFGTLHGLSLPFSWSNTVDLTLSPHYNDCDQLFDQLKLGVPQQNISNYCSSNEDGLQLAPIDFKASESNYYKLNRLYLETSMPIPDRIILSLNNGSLIVPTRIDDGEVMSNTLNFPSVVNKLRTFVEVVKSEKDTFPLFDNPRLIRRRINSTVELYKQDFLFDFTEFFSTLTSRYRFIPNAFDENLMSSIIQEISWEPDNHKYFHEPKLYSKGGGHFDWRFFKRLKYTDYERISILNRLSKSWLYFSNSVGIKTWLSHGTLLGWFWNGLNLPWDNDLDVQITMESLIKLARNYNNSVIISLEDETSFGKYYLDINPTFYQRTKENGDNVIDGRFIDIDTGFYIDITALSFSHQSRYISISKKDSVEFNQLLDPEYVNNDNSHTVVKQDYHKRLFTERANLINHQLIYNCKNNHFYKLDELSPLLATQFEGAPAYVPRDYKSILSREYPRSLYAKSFNKYCYNPKLRLWIRCQICSGEAVCQDRNMMVYYNRTKDFTATHKHNMYYRSPIPYKASNKFYIDPWLIAQSQKIIST